MSPAITAAVQALGEYAQKLALRLTLATGRQTPLPILHATLATASVICQKRFLTQAPARPSAARAKRSKSAVETSAGLITPLEDKPKPQACQGEGQRTEAIVRAGTCVGAREVCDPGGPYADARQSFVGSSFSGSAPSGPGMPDSARLCCRAVLQGYDLLKRRVEPDLRPHLQGDSGRDQSCRERNGPSPPKPTSTPSSRHLGRACSQATDMHTCVKP